MKQYIFFPALFLLFGIIQGNESGLNSGTDHYQNSLNSQVLQQQQQPSAQVYYYQHHPDSSGYYSNNYQYPPAYSQKQDLFGGGGTTDLLGDAGDDIGGAIGGVVAAIAALLGLKGLTKLGAAALFIFIFVIIPLFLLPIVLSIAAIALSAMDPAGGSNPVIMMKEWWNGNKRAMSTFESFIQSEDCIERISCSIGKRVGIDGYSRYVLRGTKANHSGDRQTKGKETNSSEKPGFLGRVSRGLKAENCVSYKCSIMSRFT